MNNCNCQPQSSRPAVPTPYTKQFACNQELAMAYVPWQRWRDLYDSNKGFHRGTIFRELDKPFCGKGGVCQ